MILPDNITESKEYRRLLERKCWYYNLCSLALNLRAKAYGQNWSLYDKYTVKTRRYANLWALANEDLKVFIVSQK